MKTHADVANEIGELLRSCAERSLGCKITPASHIQSRFVLDNRLYAWMVGKVVYVCAWAGQVGHRVVWLANTTTPEWADTRTRAVANWNAELLPLSKEDCRWLLDM